MPAFLKSSDADVDKYREELLQQFPGAEFGAHWNLRKDAFYTLRSALADSSEESIQKALTANPYLIQYAVSLSGHHGIWVFPKPMIKTPAADGSEGLIPDYLIATRSSLGYFWHRVELKRFDNQFANKKGRGLSKEGQAAVDQCNRYLTHFDDYIETVRNNVRVSETIRPEGAIRVQSS
jgi:hypothetical protein